MGQWSTTSTGCNQMQADNWARRGWEGELCVRLHPEGHHCDESLVRWESQPFEKIRRGSVTTIQR